VSDKWEGFVNKLQNLVQKDPDRNEAETKSKLVEPVLKEMGWGLLDDKVELEYPVSFATSKTKVDYALKQNERPVVFVEAKALHNGISHKYIKQALDYSTHEDVRWCVVTNGKEWRIYDANKYKDEKFDIEPSEARVERLKLEDFSDRKEALEIISRGSIESGDTAKRVQSIWQTRSTINNFKTEKDSIKEKVADVLKEQSGDLLDEKLESLAGKFTNDVINELEDFVQEEEKKEDVGETEETGRRAEPYELDPEKLERGSEQDLSFAKIDQARLGKKTDITNWRGFINEAVIRAIENEKEELVLDTIPNAQKGATDKDASHYFIEKANISLTPMSANRCIYYTYILAQELNLEFLVKFHWRDKEKALYPGKRGVIHFEANIDKE